MASVILLHTELYRHILLKMAKSLRSKTQRANRAKKRDRYSVKEMAKLKKVVEAVKEAAADQEVKSTFTVIGENEESMAIDNPVNMPVSSTNPASDVQGSAEQGKLLSLYLQYIQKKGYIPNCDTLNCQLTNLYSTGSILFASGKHT